MTDVTGAAPNMTCRPGGFNPPRSRTTVRAGFFQRSIGHA
jgi:hypothetical protein